MTRISVISVVIKYGRRSTRVFYPTSSTEIPKNCVVFPDEQAHFWLTDNGEPPEDGERCMCGKIQYQ